MNYNIRPANPQDGNVVVPLIIQAMTDLACKLTGTLNPIDAIPLFEYLFNKPDNQYSYKHCLVFEDKEGVVGSIIGYDGGRLKDLRHPVLAYVFEKYGVEHVDLEPETESGEFYIDTVSVLTSKQGRGIGRRLIKAMISRATEMGHKRIGLLVEQNNPSAKRLYESISFSFTGHKHLAGGLYEHLLLEL